jgi:hypothetical protein
MMLLLARSLLLRSIHSVNFSLPLYLLVSSPTSPLPRVQRPHCSYHPLHRLSAFSHTQLQSRYLLVPIQNSGLWRAPCPFGSPQSILDQAPIPNLFASYLSLKNYACRSSPIPLSCQKQILCNGRRRHSDSTARASRTAILAARSALQSCTRAAA